MHPLPRRPQHPYHGFSASAVRGSCTTASHRCRIRSTCSKSESSRSSAINRRSCCWGCAVVWDRSSLACGPPQGHSVRTGIAVDTLSAGATGRARMARDERRDRSQGGEPNRIEHTDTKIRAREGERRREQSRARAEQRERERERESRAERERELSRARARTSASPGRPP